MRKSLVCLIGIVAVGFACSSASATTYFYEPFDYTPPGSTLDDLSPISGKSWQKTSTGATTGQTVDQKITSSSLTGNASIPTPVGNMVTYGAGTYSDRINLLNGGTNVSASGSYYYSFLLNVVDLGGLPNPANAHNQILAGFNNGVGEQTGNPTNVAATLWIGAGGGTASSGGTSATTFQLGTAINTASSNATRNYKLTNYAVNDTLFVVGRYTFGAGDNQQLATTSLWVYDITTGDTVPAALPTSQVNSLSGSLLGSTSQNLASFLLYSTNGTSTANHLGTNGVNVDEVRVATTWTEVIGIQSLYWDIDGLTAGAGVAPQSGTWDDSATNWSASSTGNVAGQTWIDGFNAVFAAGTNADGAYTVTVSGTTKAVSGLTFEEGTSTLNGGTLNLTSTLSSAFNASAGAKGIVNSNITGTVGINKLGTGTVVLGGSNSYGTTTINSGTLQFAKTGSMPTSGAVTVAGGTTLAINAGNTVGGEWSASTDENAGGTIASIIKGRGGQGLAGQVTWTAGSTFGIDATNATGTLTYTGVIGGFTTNSGPTDNITLKTLGSGTLALANTNTYSGGTNLGGGTLEVSSDANLGNAAGGITFSTASTLRLTSSISTARGITVSATGTVDAPTSTNSTLSGVISGTSTLVKDGAGTLQLTAANTLSGSVRSKTGTLLITNDHALQNAALDMSTTDTGAVIFDNSLTTITLGGLIGSRNFTANSAANLIVGNNDKTAGPYTGALGGTGSLTKVGAGRQTISGDNSYSGGTNINAGTLQFGQTSGMPISGNVTVASGGTLSVNVGATGEWANSTDESIGGTIGSLIKGRGGRGTAGQISWTAGSSMGINTNDVTVGTVTTYNGIIGGFRSVTVAGDYNNNGTVDAADYVIWRKSDGTQSGYDTWRANFGNTAPGTTNNVGLTKLGSGTLELTGTNTYTGPTTINIGTATNRSVLLNGTTTALTSSTLMTFASGTNAENRWELHDSALNPVNATVRGLSGGSTDFSGTGTDFNDATNVVVGYSTLTMEVPTGETYTYNGFLSSSGDLFDDNHRGQVIKNGGGRIDLTANNGTSNFNGEFVLNAGTVGIGDQQNFGSSSSSSTTARLTINGGTLISTSGDGESIAVRKVKIGGSFTFNNTAQNVQFHGNQGNAEITLAADNPTITVNPQSVATPNDGGVLIFSGKVQDDGSPRGFTKAGKGILTLSNPQNSYTGETTILDGTLRLSKTIGSGPPQGDGRAGTGRINLSGGTLSYNGGNLTAGAARTLVVANPVRVTANSAITYLNTTSSLTDITDPSGIVFEFTSGSIDRTGGTLTLRHDGFSTGITFRPTFSGTDFNYNGPVVIDNGGSGRKTVMQSTNTSGTQTWSDVISGDGSFLHNGAGTAVLSGINTYTGNTTVQAGTLSITHPYLASTADVLLTTGAVFNLNFTGTDIINRLFFDTTSQAMGTWGAIGSAAVHQSALFTGSGLLQVSVFPGSGSSLGEGGAVPEPATLSLLMLAACSALVSSRRGTRGRKN